MLLTLKTMKILVILLTLILIGISVGIFIFDANSATLDKLNLVLLVLTLIALLWYTYATNDIAKASRIQAEAATAQLEYVRKQIHYLEGPNLLVDLGKPYCINDNTIGLFISEIRTAFIIGTSSKQNLSAKVTVVFRYVPNNNEPPILARHHDPMYSGINIWNIQNQKNIQAHFSLTNFIMNGLRLKPRDFYDSLHQGTSKGRLEVAVFSSYALKDDDCFIENTPTYHYLDINERFVFGPELTWVLIASYPPQEMYEIAQRIKETY